MALFCTSAGRRVTASGEDRRLRIVARDAARTAEEDVLEVALHRERLRNWLPIFDAGVRLWVVEELGTYASCFI